MNEKNLFRQAVLNTKKNRYYGSVSINTSIHYKVLTIGFTIMTVMIILFLIFAEFSEKFTVLGYLNSTKGIIRIFPNKNGVILKSYGLLGTYVHRGDALFLIDTSTENKLDNNKLTLLRQLEKRKKAIEDHINYKKTQLDSLKKLLTKKYISLATYNEKNDELIALNTNKNIIEIEIINYNNNQSYTIRAPVDGIVASVIYKEGQFTTTNKPLIKLLPIGADLVAELFIPTKQAGFLQVGGQVTIHYDAYPYQRFGSAKATIIDISQSILTDDEEDKPLLIKEPYYKVTAKLEKQFINLYGRRKKIQHGMTISAIIVGSKFKLWQWIFDPIYSFIGELR